MELMVALSPAPRCYSVSWLGDLSARPTVACGVTTAIVGISPARRPYQELIGHIAIRSRLEHRRIDGAFNRHSPQRVFGVENERTPPIDAALSHSVQGGALQESDRRGLAESRHTIHLVPVRSGSRRFSGE